MKFKVIFLIVFLFSATIVVYAAHIIDVGASITGSYIKTIYNGKEKQSSEYNNKSGAYKLGFQFIVDKLLDKKGLMNYRLGINYQNGITDNKRSTSMKFFSKYSLHSIIWTNTLGFGLIREDKIRFWLGPQLSISYDFHNTSKKMFLAEYSGETHKLMFVYLGLVTGCNYLILKNLFLTGEIGIKFGYGGSFNASKLRLIKIEPLINIGCLFRI